MSLPEHVLNRVVLEIRYDDGIVYLDRCGSLTVSLDRILGKPFKNTVAPTMTHGEFSSALERLNIRYGPQHFQVDQTWLETTVRFEKVAPLAWSEVSKRLDVESKVTRCGLRLFMMWQVSGVPEGQKALVGSGLVGETKRWSEVMGSSTSSSFTGISDRGDLRLRAKLGLIEMKLEGRFFPEDEKFAFEHGIQLDLDYTCRSLAGAFSREKLQGFIQESVRDARRLTDTVGELCRAAK